MKSFCFGLLLLVWCLPLGAQTDPPAAGNSPAPSASFPTNQPPATNAPAAAPTRIDIIGDRFEVNYKTDIGTYVGHAGIDSPEMHLRCDVLRFELPRLNATNYNRITALSNVVIDLWNTNHLTGDKAIYTKSLSNGVPAVLLELIGNASVTNPAVYIVGANYIVYDPISGDMHHDGRMTVNVATNNGLASPFGETPQMLPGPKPHRTNAPAIKPQIKP
jgi:hypothetical protein